MTNHLLGIVLADGEIFSNLHFTQHLYDHVAGAPDFDPSQPINVDVALSAARTLLPSLLSADRIAVHQLLVGDELSRFLDDLGARTRDGAGMGELLHAAVRDSTTYHAAYIQKKGRSK
jgi:CRISPR-associated protein Csc2